jgi:hypothetical protein
MSLSSFGLGGFSGADTASEPDFAAIFVVLADFSEIFGWPSEVFAASSAFSVLSRFLIHSVPTPYRSSMRATFSSSQRRSLFMSFFPDDGSDGR